MFQSKMRTNLVLGFIGMLTFWMIGVQSRANAAPGNDNFTKATIITGKSSSIAGTNIGATKETNEPNPGPYWYSCKGDSVWYRWKAPASGGVTFTAKGNFNSVLGIYTGSTVANLTDQTEFQPGLGTTTSSATFNAIADTTYSILVDDYEGDTGNFTLSWQYGPSNDDFAHATLVSGPVVHAKGTNVDSSRELNEPNPGPYWYCCQGRSVWYRWKAPASGGVTFTAKGNFNSVVGIYTGLYVDSLTDQTEFQPGLGTTTSSATFNAIAGTTYSILIDDYEGDTGTFTLTSSWGPANDDFAHASLVSGPVIRAKGTNVDSSRELNEPNPGPYWYCCQGRSVWYRWRAPASGGVTVSANSDFNGVIGIYTGLYVDSLTDQTEFQPGLGTTTSSATFNAVEGTTYSILVDDYEGATGTFTLTSSWGPANDNFANATLISGNTIHIRGTNVDSSRELNEPNPGPYWYSCQGRSVWYRWKAPASGGVTFTATGDFGSVLGIYTGSTVASLTDQTEFQPGLGTTTSSATFNAVAGTTYSILVDDYEGDTGPFTLKSSWGPVNDNFANATVISGGTGRIGGSDENSSKESNEPNPGPYWYSCQGRSVWYRWTAPASGGVTFTATGDFGSVLGIYTGSTVANLTNQTQSQPGLGTTSSSATFNAIAGTTYSILVDDYEGATGNFTLSWKE